MHWIFNVKNSIFYLFLVYLIYCNVEDRKKYDVKLWIWTNALVWLGTVEFGQTILWKTGAVNYLWATTVILFFLTIFRVVRSSNMYLSINIYLCDRGRHYRRCKSLV
ncbi:MAG: DUF6056 family protein [Eubacteriales bacterium]